MGSERRLSPAPPDRPNPSLKLPRENAMRVMSIFGTRPEMIKLWSTLRRLDDLNFEHIMVAVAGGAARFVVTTIS